MRQEIRMIDLRNERDRHIPTDRYLTERKGWKSRDRKTRKDLEGKYEAKMSGQRWEDDGGNRLIYGKR